MSMPVLKFMGWELPPTEAAARWLRQRGTGAFPVDFSHLRIAVPTAEAGRLLRERIAALCADAGGAVNLKVTIPEQLIPRPPAAGAVQVLLAWVAALRSVDGRDFPELFRNDVLERFKDSDETLLGWAEALQKCRMTLAGEGLDLAGAADILDRLCRERSGESGETHFRRFAEFRELEKHYLRTFERISGGALDPASALLEATESPQLPENIEKIILIDCADLPGAPRRFLERAAAGVECWIGAPEKFAEHFDGFGCPEPGFWNSAEIALDPEKQIRILPRPDRQAKKILELVAAAPEPPSAVAVIDPEVADALETRAELAAGSAPDRNGVPEFFVPREIPLAELPWSQLLCAIVRLNSDPEVSAAAEVWRSPLFADYATDRLDADAAAAMRLLDELREEHFVNDAPFLDRLLRNLSNDRAAGLVKLAEAWKEWRRRLAEAENPVVEAFMILAEIGEANRLRHLDLRRSESEVDALRQVVAELAEASAPPALLAALLRRRLAGTKIRIREEAPDAVDVVGFLELPWRNIRTVLIAGFNDNCLASESADDLFLPDAARRELGMMTKEKRRAADALHFKALSERCELRILCGRTSQSGETLFPSRLLFQCSPRELPKRVEALFRDGLVEDAPPPDSVFPPFLPRRAAASGMRITGFKSYLKCPFGFYLEQVLGLRRHDPEPPELDALGYGTFTHAILQKCPRDGAADESALAETMRRRLRSQMRDDFGDNIPGLVKLQCEMIADSLEYFAKAQAAEFAAGWRIVAAEIPVRIPWGDLFRRVFPDAELEKWRDDITLSGKIDRIDFRIGVDGVPELRVLDYKTSANADTPAETHLSHSLPKWGADERFALERVSGKSTRRFYWQDLQLPLYVLLTRHVLQGTNGIPEAEKFSAGYFDLPQELTRTGIDIFAELDIPGVVGSAAKCADAILKRIFVDGIFWPPSEREFEIFPGCGIATARFRDPAGSDGRAGS